jgi:hypothetical protein
LPPSSWIPLPPLPLDHARGRSTADAPRAAGTRRRFLPGGRLVPAPPCA